MRTQIWNSLYRLFHQVVPILTYDWATSIEAGDTATANTDYSTSSDTNVVINASAPSDTINVPIIGDNVPEDHETFTVTLSNPSGATLLTTSVQGTITNDDGFGLSIANATLVEGADGATGKMQFTVTAFPTPDSEVTATWTTTDETGDDSMTSIRKPQVRIIRPRRDRLGLPQIRQLIPLRLIYWVMIPLNLMRPSW